MKSESGKITLALVLTVSLMAFGIFSFNTTSLLANNDNITICHKNNGNGWSKITVDDDAINGQGGGDHNTSQHQNGQDIIPSGYWDWNGRNWDATGQAIWNNNCNVPSSSPTATPSLTPTATATATATATSTARATATATTTSTPVATATPSLTPTATATATSTSQPCDEDCNEPTSTPTSTPVTTETPNSDLCVNIDGIQYLVPEGKHLDASGKNCVEFGVPGVPESGIGGGQVLGTSTGQVLGASTMAGTGSIEDSVYYLLFTIGSLLLSFDIIKKSGKIAL